MGGCLPLIRGYIHVYDHNIYYIFFSEIARPIKAKLHVEHPWEGGMKVYINGQGHMTKMAAMAINSKMFKNLLLQNQKAYDFETCRVLLNSNIGVLNSTFLILTPTF